MAPSTRECRELSQWDFETGTGPIGGGFHHALPCYASRPSLAGRSGHTPIGIGFLQSGPSGEIRTHDVGLSG